MFPSWVCAPGRGVASLRWRSANKVSPAVVAVAGDMGGGDKGEVGECAEPGAPDPCGTTIGGKRYIRHQLIPPPGQRSDPATVLRGVCGTSGAGRDSGCNGRGVQQFLLQVHGCPRPMFRHQIEVRHCQAGVPEDLHSS